MAPGRNRREFTRSSSGLVGELRVEGFAPLDGKVRDVSLKGIFIECDASFPEGQSCVVAVYLDGEPERGPEIDVQGQVSRCDAGGVAVKIRRMDRESYQHLRKLILYNSVDPGVVEDEFEAHIGLRRRT